MSNKGTTSIVGYIAMLMIAGAALGHGEAPLSAYGLQTNAIAYHETASSPSFLVPRDSRLVKIEIEGKSYDAFIIASDVETDKLKLSF